MRNQNEILDKETGELVDTTPAHLKEKVMTPKGLMTPLEWNALTPQQRFPYSKMSLLPDMTVPDQSMSVKQLMDRYARGLPLEGERVPIYNGEEDDLPDLAHMDLADREEYINNAKEEILNIKTKHNAKKQQQPKDSKPAPPAKQPDTPTAENEQ